MSSLKIFMDVANEEVRQDKLHGAARSQSDLLWLGILAEEFGEAAKEVLERDCDKLREELVQVIAVGVQWIRAIDKREGTQKGKVL